MFWCGNVWRLFWRCVRVLICGGRVGIVTAGNYVEARDVGTLYIYFSSPTDCRDHFCWKSSTLLFDCWTSSYQMIWKTHMTWITFWIPSSVSPSTSEAKGSHDYQRWPGPIRVHIVVSDNLVFHDQLLKWNVVLPQGQGRENERLRNEFERWCRRSGLLILGRNYSGRHWHHDPAQLYLVFACWSCRHGGRRISAVLSELPYLFVPWSLLLLFSTIFAARCRLLKGHTLIDGIFNGIHDDDGNLYFTLSKFPQRKSYFVAHWLSADYYYACFSHFALRAVQKLRSNDIINGIFSDIHDLRRSWSKHERRSQEWVNN